jgi:HAE1 family hydrophobic/amphiphilic exporter-1
MTTVSVMAALLPIATGLEEGSELLQSVALVLIGGLVTSTLLTLVFVPAMYTIFDDLQASVVRLFRRLSRSGPAVAAESPPTATPAPPTRPLDGLSSRDGRPEPEPAGSARRA